MERQGALNEKLLAVHVNYLGPGDATLLGRRKVNVVHCPRSHTYFRHQPFPLAQLLSARVNICLGTDSLASVYKARKRSVELSMFDEMRELASRMPSLPPEKILQMATINGARALGRTAEIGEFCRQAFADVITIPLAGKPVEAFEEVVYHRGRVTASMIDGQWVVPPSGFDT
jgi:cytosine/adenosine deaminase-related metal-dependent hydrolase